MGFVSAKEIKEIEFVVSGGVNEVSAVSNVSLKNLLKMVNWRVSKDGERIEKRSGLTKITNLTGGDAVDIFGYGTYTDVSLNFCQIIVTEAKIWRKVGVNAWTAIHTWASTLAHPVKIMEIQNRIYILSEIENVMILSNGTKVQAGISPPTTIPTIAATYDATLLSDDFPNLTLWTDEDAGAGDSSQVTFDSKTCLKLLTTAVSGDLAKRSQTITGLGPEFSVEMDVYFDLLDCYQKDNYFQLNIYNGRVCAQVRIDKNDLFVYSGAAWVSAGITIVQDKWHSLKFYINTKEPGEEYLSVFMNDVSYGDYYVTYNTALYPGKVELLVKGYTVAVDVKVDKLQIASNDGGNISGQVRYAVGYIRSGNYGGFSNPIKSKIGTVAFTGTHLNDLTITGTYTGDKTKTIVVKIDGTPAAPGPDTYKWSEDNGLTWLSTANFLATKCYLNYGIELNFAATTGHTLNEYWTFIVYSMAVSTCHQKVTLTSLPVSTDAQVDFKNIYRTSPGGIDYYVAATIPNAMTTYVDNLPLAWLGEDMREDCDIVPKGKYQTWWDDRLWVFDEDENIVYYSDINRPEHFSIAYRYVSVRMGEQGDIGTGLIVYKGILYVFKKGSIYQIQKKSSGNYGRYEVCKDFGCVAPWSLKETYGLLTFLSYRGWEVFNGCEGFSTLFSLPVSRTLATIDKTKYSLISSAQNKAFDEIWLSIPDRTSGTEQVVVCNYLKGQCFYLFKFHKTPSCIVEAKDTNGVEYVYMGTRDGYLFQCDLGVQDDTTNIEATARGPWIRFPKKQTFRYMEIEYELPATFTLTTTFFVDMVATAVRTISNTGATPTGVDTDIRLPILDGQEMMFNSQYFSAKFYNNEAVGSDLKLNYCKLHEQVKVMEGKVYPS